MSNFQELIDLYELSFHFFNLLAKYNIVSCILAEKGARVIIIRIAVSSWTGLLENCSIIRWPSCRQAGFRGTEGSSTAEIILVKFFTGA